MVRRFAVMMVAMGLVIGTAGCGEDPPGAGSGTGGGSNLGGDGLPVQLPGEAYGHWPGALTGTITLESNGCWTIDLGDSARVAVFPAGFTKPDGDGTLMMGPDGTIVSNGTTVDAVGGVAAVAGLPGMPDGYWSDYLAFCDPGATEVAVLDSLTPAFDPDALDPAARMALVQDAVFTESWGCGIGFAASTADQRVALVLHVRDAGVAPAPPVTLPGDHWIAEVWIGKHLMSNWCNDAIETWVATPQITERWVVSGTLEFALPGESGCGTSVTVTGRLAGASAAAPGGAIDLGDVDLANDAFGCFAG